jgi:two-component system chemotaxis response regulator CheV
MILDMEQIITGFFPNLNFEEINEEIIQPDIKSSRESLRIYFAEDSMMIQKHVVKALLKVGIGDVVAFNNGQEAYDQLMALDQNSELPQLLITDIEMPQMDGLTLCRKVCEKENLKNVPVLIFSSLVNDQMIAKCRKVGAKAWVTKPELNRLINTLDELCKVEKAA